MNVWIALYRYFPHGGLQRDALRTAAALADAGHEVTIVCAVWDAPEGDDLPAGIERRVLGARGATNHGRVENFGRALKAAHRDAGTPFLLGFDKLPGIDAYFTADVCFVARVRRSRSALHRLTPRYRTFARLEGAVFSPLVHTAIFSLAPQVELEYRAEYGTPESRFIPLPPGVSPDRRASDDAGQIRADTRAKHGLGGDAIALLFVGANFTQKGLDRALAGVASLPVALRERVRLLVAGPGDIQRFERRARSMGLAGMTTFLSATDEIPALLQAADILVHPARVENTGTVIVEALTAGLPVLCSGECGYALHVRASGAGIALDTPYVQQDFDTALAQLCEADRVDLRSRALCYAAETDLSSMHATIVRSIERLARQSAEL